MGLCDNNNKINKNKLGKLYYDQKRKYYFIIHLNFELILCFMNHKNTNKQENRRTDSVTALNTF